MATIFTSGQFQAIGNDGKVVPYGKLYFYEAGTLTPVNSYTTALKDATNTIPVILSATGKADVYLDEGLIDIVLQDSYGTVIWSIENFESSNTFDNTGTGLTSTNNQDAIVEVLEKTHFPVDTIADLRLMTITPSTVYVTGYHTANDGAFGSNFFKKVPNIYADNGMTIFVTAGGTYKLQFSGFLNLKFAGAKGDGATDDSEAILRAYKVFIGSDYSTLFVPSGTYMTKEFGSASSQPGWAGLAGLSGKTILGDGSTSIFKLIGGENTALFNQAMFTSKIESIRFDGNNPPPAWTGDQTGLYTLNPLTENLVMIDGFGYDLPNCVAQFSGGNGFYLKGNNGVIDIRGANSKSWYNWGWGYYITECFTLRGNSPWVEQNIVGGIHIDAGTVVADRTQYLDSNITFKNIYYERVSVYPTGHATNTSTGVEIEGICGVQIDGLNSLLAPNDTHIHIKENPLSIVGTRGSYGTKISLSTNTLRIKIDDNCDNTTIIRNGIAGGISNSRTLILEDNARNTKVVWDSLPNAIKLSENSNKATIYGIDSNLASASATKSNGTVVQGGVLGAIADYDSTFGSQAELSLNSLIANSYSSLYNNHVLPISTQLYVIIGLKAEASCQISFTLQDAVTNQYYNFDTEVFETLTASSIISYNLKTDTNNIWYSIPFMTDATAGRKLRIKISASSNDGKTPSLYHAFIADRREPQITSLRSSIQIRNGNVIKCTTALRPLPTLVKEGNSFFNTTTKLLNISDGTNWLNPAGVIV